MTDETPEARRARKAAERAANAARIEQELGDSFLRPLPTNMGFHDCQAEHTRLRMKVVEIQNMVIAGKMDIAKAQDFEKRLVGQIHAVEERARNVQQGGYVPKPGE
jgi:cell wall assembly regulator SMI1